MFVGFGEEWVPHSRTRRGRMDPIVVYEAEIKEKRDEKRRSVHAMEEV